MMHTHGLLGEHKYRELNIDTKRVDVATKGADGTMESRGDTLGGGKRVQDRCKEKTTGSAYAATAL